MRPSTARIRHVGPADHPAVHVVVSLGTDHHHFDRLMRWLALWASGTRHAVRLTVQHGSTAVPPALVDLPGTTAYALVPHEDLLADMRAADVVVVQGGPGSIMDALESGRLPVAVPRLAALHEVVDDHQVAFVERMAQEGMAVAATSYESFVSLMDAAMSDPTPYAVEPRDVDTSDVVDRVGSWVDTLLEQHPPHGLVRLLDRASRTLHHPLR